MPLIPYESRLLPAMLTAAGAMAVGLALPGTGMATPVCGDVAKAGQHPADMRITEAVSQPADAAVAPAHCLVRGVMAERQGADGKPYGIRFEIRLPDEWNGRFVHQFNGGSDGEVVPAYGRLLGGNKADTALSRGYAVVSSDAGHDGKAYGDKGLAGSTAFGFDATARRDYGYGAVATLNPAAIALVERYYGRKIAYRYGIGSSNGGRHGLVAASRLPDQFDGLLVGYPGFNLPRAALQHALDVQSWSKVNSDITKAFSAADMILVAKAITAACDGLDGRNDGIVADSAACQTTFRLDSLRCSAAKTPTCLSGAQIDALEASHGGPRDSKGNQLYSEWVWDPGIGSRNWRGWKLESPIKPWDNQPIIAVMGAASLAQVFTTPPTPLGPSPGELRRFLLNFDFDRDAPKILATSADFPESPVSVMSPPDLDNPSLKAFQSAGHKMIIFHGNGDPVFSVLDTIKWYKRLDANTGGKAKDFARFYQIPGMPHGAEGPAYTDFDFLTPLVAWVEQGKAPEAIPAKAMADNPEAAGLAPGPFLYCPYPQITRQNTAGTLVCQ